MLYHMYGPAAANPTRQYKHIIGFHTIDMENDGI